MPKLTAGTSILKDTATVIYGCLSSRNTQRQGRILIPQVQRDYADLQKDVVVAGVLNRVEIWNRERWQAENTYDDMDKVAEHMAELGLRI